MFHLSKTSVRLFAVAGLAAGSLCVQSGRADAQIEGADILYHYNGTGIVAAPQEPGTPLTELFNRQTGAPFPGAEYENDTGMDVTPGFDGGYQDANGNNNAFQFSKVIIQQVSFTPGLSAFYQFDGATSVFGAGADPNNPNAPIGFWELSRDPVDSSHDSATDLFTHALYIRGASLITAGDDPGGTHYFHQHFIFETPTPGNYSFTYNVIGTLLNGTTLAPQQFTINYSPAASAVPEPGTLAILAGLGTTGLGLVARRRARRSH